MKKQIGIITPGGIGAGYFSQGYPPLVYFIKKLSREYDITVYSIYAVNPGFVPDNFKIRSAPASIKSSKLRNIVLASLLLFDHLRNPFHLLHAFWVYPAGTVAVLLGKLIRVPTIVTIQGGEAAWLPQIGYGNMIKPIIKRWTLWTCEQTTCLNSISEFLVVEMKKHGLKRNDAVIIPFGPETSLFEFATKTKDETLKIVHVANLTEVKDQVTLLKAFQVILKQQPAELKIIGGDFMKGKLQRLTDEMGLNKHVKFLGAIPNIELPKYYAWADMMLHTSFHEGQSGVVMEAMASGVVVCGTRVGILFDLGEKYFATANVGDHETLATETIKLWQDENKFNELKKNALQWTVTFDANWTVHEFSKLYKQISK